ncbi:sensor histidine kinase [Bifidobacterium pseudolongum]|uniref:sensor histidine kinase n=1 Tax=Bifidobacterium pseudolongum TaxID=1694 RepID=UPI000C6FFE07|nr:HAMP domain-containing sensor histidine kinase [Bifidobacterium pseudolongum]MCH4849963.1 HAMP domain-containing histidine kinase [Bifidobacterium pseudolongum]PKV05763.1 sensor protein [Bifidobacterium pseudolongum subsp. globosum]RYQ56614.1 two-component system sensor histidine kinase [Bifidobacterium pseudolongum subsp. globosum]RYQ60535.1 two-component system sensor histidine kinase [Bifidobacterium pseudolongum subsp. globosum]RYQ65097.1 two-component system sensor histidine kinase [Bi
MPTIESERGRDDAQRDTKRPISLRAELTILIVVSSVLAFKLAWIATMIGLNGWIAPPIAIASTQVFTYVTSRHLTRPLAQMIDAAQAMAEGDYSARVHIKKNSRDEVGKLADAFNIMADELEHADQMRRDMIANVSHELRTPVSALQAMVENMADGIVEPTPANLESILTQTHRLSDLISFLLDLSRLEAGAASLEIVPINLAEFISETTGPLEYADAGHGHTIEQRIPDDLNLEGDEARLHQLFTNIIANALKHSPDSTAILIEAHDDGTNDTVVVNVVNFGSHIPESVRNDIFRRFVKGKSGPGTESGGTGLGLSIARWAAQLHGGTVQVIDDPRGVNFEIVLPRYPQIAEQGNDES